MLTFYVPEVSSVEAVKDTPLDRESDRVLAELEKRLESER
jgi:hypothetical protein